MLAVLCIKCYLISTCTTWCSFYFSLATFEQRHRHTQEVKVLVASFICFDYCENLNTLRVPIPRHGTDLGTCSGILRLIFRNTFIFAQRRRRKCKCKRLFFFSSGRMRISRLINVYFIWKVLPLKSGCKKLYQ